MSDLSFAEKMRLEAQFNMGSGYVLNFSNRTFQEFIFDSVRRNIYDSKYSSEGSSKANRLRAFWKIEPNHLVGKLTADLLDYCRDIDLQSDESHCTECSRIADRLRQGAPVIDMDALDTHISERDFDALVRSVRQAIDENEPETGLDRLHTYVVKYMRVLCEKHGISAPRDKPLHSLVGEYIKQMQGEGRIESEMTERILKSSISVMEAFNRVRNEQSLAHANPLLNYNESLLIFNHVVSSVRFMEALEREGYTEGEAEPTDDDGEIPF